MIINKNYTKLLSATVITRLGDSIDTIAFSWLVFIMTGSRALMGGIFVMSVLPNILVLPVAGVIADLFNKKILVTLSDLTRGLFVLILAILYFTSNLEVWHLFAFVFANNIFESIANPSRTALIQSILPQDEYTKGNSYISSASSFGSLVGLGLAGLLIGVIGIEGAILIDAMTFFLSGFIIYNMKTDFKKRKSSKQSVRMYFEMVKEGMDYLKNETLIISLLIVSAIVSFMYVPFNVLQPVYVDNVMKMDVEGLTFLGIAFSLGMIIGGFTIGKLSNKFSSITAIGFGLLMMGVMYASLGAVDYLSLNQNLAITVILVITFLFAFFLPVIHAPLYGVIMKKIPQELIGRMMAIFSLFGLISMPLGGLLVSVIGDNISVQLLYIIMGISIIMISIVYWVPNRNKEF